MIESEEKDLLNSIEAVKEMRKEIIRNMNVRLVPPSGDRGLEYLKDLFFPRTIREEPVKPYDRYSIGI